MSEVRKIQLVARAGVLSEILERYPFPTDNHRRIIELLYQETVEEMRSFGLVEVEEDESRPDSSPSSPR